MTFRLRLDGANRTPPRCGTHDGLPEESGCPGDHRLTLQPGRDERVRMRWDAIEAVTIGGPLFVDGTYQSCDER